MAANRPLNAAVCSHAHVSANFKNKNRRIQVSIAAGCEAKIDT